MHGYTTAFWRSAAVFVVGAVACGLTFRSGVRNSRSAAEPAMAH